ncbi:hypothetical protein DXG03_006751 [Asterophora parasitica]|uniref:Uncharacterized protein n=1 Tax=Asterophora parasitica TaxID=117018 RepID=A0A9P7FZF9_9AGAR|nr:hypothetical protein DXG03_006751 [Asterophora parasitica]
MGTCSKVTFTYGFILNEKQIKKLLVALEYLDSVDGEDFDAGGDWRDVVTQWVGSDECGLAPYFFTAEAKYKPEYESDSGAPPGDAELAFSFAGSEKDEIPEHEMEVWSRDDTQSTLFQAVERPWADKEFMALAKEALKKLKNTEAFKKAKLTVVPQWFTTLSVG